MEDMSLDFNGNLSFQMGTQNTDGVEGTVSIHPLARARQSTQSFPPQKFGLDPLAFVHRSCRDNQKPIH